jgi:hypothetical protein
MSAQGGLAAAIALDFALVYPVEGVVVLAAVLTPLVVFDFFGTGRVARYLADAGEAGRRRFAPADAAADADADADTDTDAAADAAADTAAGTAAQPVATLEPAEEPS